MIVRTLVCTRFRPQHGGARYYGERNEAGPYLADLGWALNRSSIRDRLAANDLPLPEDDDMPMGDMLYVSGALEKATK